MINGRKIVVVMPAYNAEKTLERTLTEVPDAVDDIVSEMEPDSNMTLYNIMKEYNLGIMTARMVLNRISEINNG